MYNIDFNFNLILQYSFVHTIPHFLILSKRVYNFVDTFNTKEYNVNDKHKI